MARIPSGLNTHSIEEELGDNTNRKAEDPSQDRVKIILSHDDNIPPTGQFFGLNGVGYILRPGVVADVPRGLLDILNNAVYGEPEVDASSGEVIGYKNRLRFPYTIVRGETA